MDKIFIASKSSAVATGIAPAESTPTSEALSTISGSMPQLAKSKSTFTPRTTSLTVESRFLMSCSTDAATVNASVRRSRTSASASLSSATATARSTSRVKRTSARTETAKPPTRANCRFRFLRLATATDSASSIVPSVIGKEPLEVELLELAIIQRRVLVTQLLALQTQTFRHHLQRLRELLLGSVSY